MLKSRLSCALVVVGLCLSGCMSRNESRDFPGIVGREFVTTRPLFLMEGRRITSVMWNSFTPTWWLIEIEEGEKHYGFSAGQGLRQIERPGAEPIRYTELPAGTKLRVESVLGHFETGTHMIGTLVHPETGTPAPWCLDLGLGSLSEVTYPWSPKAP